MRLYAIMNRSDKSDRLALHHGLRPIFGGGSRFSNYNFSLYSYSAAFPCIGNLIASLKRKGNNKDMTRYTFGSAMFSKILHNTIDLFLKYQYEHGFEEPRAREQAIMDIIGMLRAAKGSEKPSVH